MSVAAGPGASARQSTLLSPFARLRALLAGAEPPTGRPTIALHLGESRLAVPEIGTAVLADPAGWSRYPPLGGTPELRAAYAQWLGRRFGVRRALEDGLIATEPTAGTKQAVAAAISLAVAAAAAGAPGFGDRRPVVVLPNPFYPTYQAGTEASGGRPVYYTPGDLAEDEDGTTGVTVSAIARAVARAGGPVAAVLLCNPGNPGGEVLSADGLAQVAKLTADAGALLIVDECYTDLYTGAPPPGLLALVEQSLGAPGPFLVLHTLSKRSAMPGLRSGFAAGDVATIEAYALYNRSCGVSSPFPVCSVAAALWADEAHVARLREALAGVWSLADELLGDLPGYHRPQAGFFLWLGVGDSQEAALRLWREQGLSVMPGRYLAADVSAVSAVSAVSDVSAVSAVSDVHGGTNPGDGHLRIALVHDPETMREALTRLKKGSQ